MNLQCRGDYVAYPNQIKCRRKGGFPDSGLEWSHVPLCYPSVLVSKTHWTKVLHARSVSCTGDARTGTTCKLTCIRDGAESHEKALVLPDLSSTVQSTTLVCYLVGLILFWLSYCLLGRVEI